MIRIDSSWSGLPQEPNIIVPRQNWLTETPVRPKGRCCMPAPSVASSAPRPRSTRPPTLPNLGPLHLAGASTPTVPRREGTATGTTVPRRVDAIPDPLTVPHAGAVGLAWLVRRRPLRVYVLQRRISRRD